MRVWANALGYQAVWFSAVIGAGRGLAWPGVAAAVVFALAHAALCPQPPGGRAADLRLMALALGCGLALDGGLALSGLARYAADATALPAGGAPLWILAIWVSFALTLRHSMAFLLGRPAMALVLGALGGPLAYLGAERGWQAVALAEPRWPAIAVLALGWAVVVPLLTTRALRWSGLAAPAVVATPEAAVSASVEPAGEPSSETPRLAAAQVPPPFTATGSTS